MKKLFIIPIMILLSSCENDINSDVQKNPDNLDGSVKVKISIKHGQFNDTMFTLNEIWKNNRCIEKTSYIKLLPSLGIVKQEVEDDDGNTQEISTIKDYELFITAQ